MKGNYLEDMMSERNLNRSPYRKLPEKCLKCAYASKTGFGMVCGICTVEKKNGSYGSSEVE